MNTQPKVQTIEDRIAQRVDPAIAGGMAVTTTAGGIAFANMGQVLEAAKLMAISGVAIPQHLRGNPGACLAVIIQAVEWRLSPYAVANKSYSVNDRLAYESQLIQAVILQRAPIRGRLKVEYQGAGEARTCRVSATLADTGETVDYTSPPFGRIHPKNSPLWKSDPDQQQFYYSGRALCRRHFPDVLLGIYARDELDGENARDITPANGGPRTLAGRLDALAAQPEEAETVAETPVEAPAETPAEVVDPQTGEITRIADALPDIPEDPRTWQVADAYHYGEDARARGVSRRAVVPPQIRDSQTLAPAVLAGWDSAKPSGSAAE